MSVRSRDTRVHDRTDIGRDRGQPGDRGVSGSATGSISAGVPPPPPIRHATPHSCSAAAHHRSAADRIGAAFPYPPLNGHATSHEKDAAARAGAGVSPSSPHHHATSLPGNATSHRGSTTGRIGAGVGLRQPHVEHALAHRDPSLWLEVHTENYMVAGGPRLAQLRRVREAFPVSFHGVGASLGGPTPPDPRHLAAVRRLVDAFEPVLVSEHAVWSSANGLWFADLLPLPRTGDALRQLVEGVDRYQEAIGRRILIENPTNYLPFVSEMDEPDFLNEVAARSGCNLLLDVNNVYLSARNCGIGPARYIETLSAGRIEEIHVAGHDADANLGEALLIDTHAAPVSDAVWTLLDFALAHVGPRPVLLERDGKLPSFETLMAERDRAAAALSRHHARPERISA